MGGRVCFETALRQTKLFAERHDFDDEHKDLNDGAMSEQASQLHSHGHDGGGMKRDSSLSAGYQRKTISVPCAYACLCMCVRGRGLKL